MKWLRIFSIILSFIFILNISGFCFENASNKETGQLNKVEIFMRMADKIMKQLDTTDEQEDNIYDILDKNKKNQRKIKKEINEVEGYLGWMIDQPFPDTAAIKINLDKLYENKKKITELNINAYIQIMNQLTAKQKIKIKKFQEEMQNKIKMMKNFRGKGGMQKGGMHGGKRGGGMMGGGGMGKGGFDRW